jgi:hypothetical protein
MNTASVINAFEKYERAALEAQRIQAKASLESGEENGTGIGSPVNGLQRERALLQVALDREMARSEFFQAVAMLNGG